MMAHDGSRRHVQLFDDSGVSLIHGRSATGTGFASRRHMGLTRILVAFACCFIVVGCGGRTEDPGQASGGPSVAGSASGGCSWGDPRPGTGTGGACGAAPVCVTGDRELAPIGACPVGACPVGAECYSSTVCGLTIWCASDLP